MGQIYWKVGDGDIHTIPDCATVYALGEVDMEEVWLDEYGCPSSKYQERLDAHSEDEILTEVTNCPKCGKALLTGGPEGLVRYCPYCEVLYKVIPKG